MVRAARRLFRIRDMDSPLLAEEYIVETGHQYTQPITAGMYGNMWYRVFGYRLGFTAWRRVTTCDAFKITAGIANVPARVEGWKYWETKYPMFEGTPVVGPLEVMDHSMTCSAGTAPRRSRLRSQVTARRCRYLSSRQCSFSSTSARVAAAS